MKNIRPFALTALAPALLACSSTATVTPPPSFEELTADRERIGALGTTTAMAADLPAGGTAEYRGAYVGTFLTSRTSPDTRVAAEAVVSARFGANPAMDFSLENLSSPDAPDFSGSLDVTDIPFGDFSYETSASMTVKNVPLEGEGVAESLTTPVNIIGFFDEGTDVTYGVVTTGATNDFNMGGQFAAEKQP